jgi:hypothetical protein
MSQNLPHNGCEYITKSRESYCYWRDVTVPKLEQEKAALLEALEEMVIYAEGVPGEGFAKARAAIALARGGESA